MREIKLSHSLVVRKFHSLPMEVIMPTRFDPHPRYDNRIVPKRMYLIEALLIVAILVMGYIKIIQLTGGN